MLADLTHALDARSMKKDVGRMGKKSKLWLYYLILAIIIQAVFSTAGSNGLFQAMTSTGYEILYTIVSVSVLGLLWLAMYTGRKLVDAAAHKGLHLYLTVWIILAPLSVLYLLIRIILA